MAGFSPCPLPSLSSLFNETGTGGVEAPAPLPILLSLLSAVTTKVITAGTGSYVMTGNAANLKAGRRLYANYGTFALTGQDATFIYSIQNTGSGAAVPLPSLSTLFDGVAAVGVGAASPLPSLSTLFERAVTDRLLTAGSGSFVWTGYAVTMTRGIGMTCDAGAFVAEFAPADRDLENDGDRGTFAITGSDAGLIVRRGSPALSGAYTLTMVPAALTFKFNRITAQTGAFTLNGRDATLTVVKNSGAWRGHGGLHDSWLLTPIKRKKKRKTPVVEQPADHL